METGSVSSLPHKVMYITEDIMAYKNLNLYKRITDESVTEIYCVKGYINNLLLLCLPTIP
jgi:hypothetical protein